MSESLKNLSELSDAKLAELVKSGNDSAFDVLTLRYLRNIGFLAKKYSADGYERNDFVQEGLLGLLYACRTFDSNNKASFKSYVEAAKKLGISAKSADNALQRAKKKISLHYMSLKD